MRPSVRADLGRQACTVLAIVSAIAACTASTPTADPPRALQSTEESPWAASAQDWATLRRPLALPFVDPDDDCPTTPHQPYADIAAVLGDGPVYPWGTGTVPFEELVQLPDDRPQMKVVWVIDPDRYAGPLLIRGRRIDGEGALMFQGPDEALRLELRLDTRLPSNQGSGHEYGSTVFIPHVGCFAYQIDGIKELRQIIVFEVTGPSGGSQR